MTVQEYFNEKSKLAAENAELRRRLALPPNATTSAAAPAKTTGSSFQVTQSRYRTPREASADAELPKIKAEMAVEKDPTRLHALAKRAWEIAK